MRRSLYESSPDTTRPRLERLGAITEEAVEALRTRDIEGLGAMMTEAHGLLGELGVSIPKLDALVSAALDAGAVGGKLTGGGGGGCVIALAQSGEDARRIENAMAPRAPTLHGHTHRSLAGCSRERRGGSGGYRHRARQHRPHQILGQGKRRTYHPLATSSLSLTLDELYTTTTVRFLSGDETGLGALLAARPLW